MGRTKTVAKVVPADKVWMNKQEAMAYLGVGEDFLQMLRDKNLVRFYPFSSRMIWYNKVKLDKFVTNLKVV